MTDTMGQAIERYKAEQRAQRERLVRAMAEMGRASGLEAGATILRTLAKGPVRPADLVVVAQAMESTAAEVRKKAEVDIAAAKARI